MELFLIAVSVVFVLPVLIFLALRGRVPCSANMIECETPEPAGRNVNL